MMCLMSMRVYLSAWLTVVSLLLSFSSAVTAEFFPEKICKEAKNAPTMFVFPEQGILTGWVSHAKQLEVGKDGELVYELLVDQAGKRIRMLKNGDTIPRGSYIRSTVNAACLKHRAEFCLLANPKISAAEYTKPSGSQVHQPYALEEKKSSGVYWHYEQGGHSLNNITSYRVEMEGTFLIAPAYAELMFDTVVRGNSDSFYLIVKD